MRQLSKALEYYEKSLQITEDTLGKMNSDYAATLNGIGIVLKAMG